MDVDLDECRLADRVDHCVPIFKEKVELISGMPAGTLVPLVPPGFILSASESPGWSRFGGSLLHTLKNPEAFQVTEETAPVLRSTWLHTSADQWFEVERQVKWQELDAQEAPLPFVADLMVTEFPREPQSSGEPAKLAVSGEPARRAVPEGGASSPSKGAGSNRDSAARIDENSDKEWVDELEPNHFLTHYPKSRKCNICLQAKLTGHYHRRHPNQRQTLQDARNIEEPEGPPFRMLDT